MPHHIHLIIVLDDAQISLFNIIKRFKSKTTVFAKKITGQDWQKQQASLTRTKQRQASLATTQLQRLWQPNYYEHVIRNEAALRKIREYIENNPYIEQMEFNQFYNK